MTKMPALCATLIVLAAAGIQQSWGADYAKRIQALDPRIQKRLIGKWTNPVDQLVIEIVNCVDRSGVRSD
jgi:hypothetical protein